MLKKYYEIKKILIVVELVFKFVFVVDVVV